jgi:thiamine biosynthesis protein ThiI
MSKEKIISEAQNIGTYEVSILPFSDCCTVFSPKHPVIYGDVKQANALYEALDIEPLIDEALEKYEVVK